MENTGKFVFHGSESEIDIFEPRQAHNFIDGIHHPDGEPAVFTSSVAEYAIFMAVINKTNCPKGYHSSAGSHSGVMKYSATEDTLSQLQNSASGWVYVFDRDLFEQRKEDGVEYVSFKMATPIEKLKVSKEDLPDNIEIF